MIRRALLLPFLCASIIAQAQGPTATAVLDTTVIRLGEQVKLDLAVIYRVDQGTPGTVIWPSLSDTITKQVEVVWDGGVDTALVDAAKDPYLFVQRRHLVVTAWDSGFWAIPPFRFVVASDTIETTPLLLEVRTLPVDTSKAFRDIKDIYDVPFSWRQWLRENWPYVAGGVAVLALLLFVLWRVRKYRNRPVSAAPEAPMVPLHQRVIDALRAVEQQRLWQQGEVKAHHSAVTDLLRGYIEERYQVPALERTTDELAQALRLSAMGAAHREQITNLLRLADLVKFAKLSPAPLENEQMIPTAIRLVQETTEAMSTQPVPDASRT
ncbi:MAG: hypothetical protein IPK99_01950 [Flavobacteriales bacterium]|nr:hypothetical protein [Flavobacteriales bacterium]